MDYLTLGLGSLTSIVTEVDVSAWGHRVTLSCQYNPGSEDRLSTITFHAALARETPNPLLMCLFNGCTSSVLLQKKRPHRAGTLLNTAGSHIFGLQLSRGAGSLAPGVPRPQGLPLPDPRGRALLAGLARSTTRAC